VECGDSIGVTFASSSSELILDAEVDCEIGGSGAGSDGMEDGSTAVSWRERPIIGISHSASVGVVESWLCDGGEGRLPVGDDGGSDASG